MGLAVSWFVVALIALAIWGGWFFIVMAAIATAYLAAVLWRDRRTTT